MNKISLFSKMIILTSISLNLFANAVTPKQTLEAGYILNYKVLPKPVDHFSDIFTEGMIYGRLRANWLFQQYDNESEGNVENQNILGLGGSLLYKTAPYAGFSAVAGIYYASAGTNIDNQPSAINNLKSGKDLINRYNAVNGRSQSFAVLAQAYIQYEHQDFKARIGREVFNSFFTKSNDSKMIPNTFEGISLESKDIKKTRLRAAYLTKQKLRDHDNFHSVIMYDDRDTSATNTNTSWNENDDAAVHKGLNYSNFEAAGINKNPGLAVIDGYTRALFTDNLKVAASAVYLKDLFATGMVELNYKLDLGNGYTLTPGARYVQQFDDGAGAIGGASLSGKAAETTFSTEVNPDVNIRNAYTNPDSVDAKMYAARLVIDNGEASVSLGYTGIADEADFITPWRSFITSGYTREMARYNWIANTQTYRLLGSYDFEKANIVDGLRTVTSLSYEDYDEAKLGEKVDARLYYVAFIKDIQAVPNLSFRFRAQWVDLVSNEQIDNGQMRLEVNYLF
ncbi:MAG TPA: outer membrane porin, OprD family [Sulfurimonas sp.]|nr:outer membrane porin, OprD family [Sulfurimonas sp.]